MFRTLCRMLFALLPCAMLTLATMALSSHIAAQVVLKPNGRSAFPLRTKALRVDTVIERQFAVSTLTLTFHNDVGPRIEADFLYTLPPNTLVTNFAYWYGEEKVTARVVEKERAAAIYAYITARMRDPALIEMVGKNTFRARIFPVMPNADLKVEMQLVQALPADAQGMAYELPLPTDRGQQLDALNVRVQVKAAEDIDRVLNNWGLPITRANGAFHFHLNGANYRPVKDLRVTVIRPPRPLHAELLSARSGGPDGFFALALTPDHSLHAPTVQIRGVTTYQTLPVRLPDVKADHPLLLVGRYKGSGRATVTLTGQAPDGRRTYAQSVTFGSELIPNNAASKLWAARQIEQLSANGAGREAVIALSLRHTLPSKYTSWLAIPKAELQRYAREKAEAEMNVIAGQLAHRIAEGRGNTPASRRLRAQLTAACKQTGYFPEERLRFALEQALKQLYGALEQAKQQKAPPHQIADWQAQLRRLSHIKGLSVAPIAGDFYYSQLWQNINRVARRLAQEIEAGRPYSSQAKKQRLEMNRLRKLMGSGSLDAVNVILWQEESRVAQEWLEFIKAGREKKFPPPTIREQVLPLSWLLGGDSVVHLAALLNGRMSELATQLVVERKKEPADTARIAQWEAEYRQLKAQIDPEYPDTYILAAEAQQEYRQSDVIWRQSNEERNKPNPNEQRIADLEAQAKTHYKIYADKMQEVTKAYQAYYGKRAERRVRQDDVETALARPRTASDRNQLLALQTLRADLLHHQTEIQAETRARGGDPLIQVEAPPDAANVVALMPDGDIKRLLYNPISKKWEARFDIPMTTKEGAYVVQIIIALKDGTRKFLTMRYHVDTTPPKAAGTAQITPTGEPTLRLEVEADADTARISALLPWGEPVSLQPSSEPNRFFALVPIPAARRGTLTAVTYIVTDKAHNRTTITVDMKP